MNTEQAIKAVEKGYIAVGDALYIPDGNTALKHIILTALCEKQERENPKPLTLEELQDAPAAFTGGNVEGKGRSKMREILFRGKRTDNGEWIEGALLYTVSWTGAVTDARIVEDYLDDDIPQLFQHEVEPSTVGQYTGLCDKNGKQIYEGDIVEWDGQSMDTYKIIYGDDASFFGVPINGRLEQVAGESLSLLNADLGIVVVGNIHDNLELLEEAK